MNYPYQDEFYRYCKTVKHYTDSTMLIVEKSIANFWKYYVANSPVEATINHVQTSDIQAFLNSLETNLGLKKNTINKYISHIKAYFTFLYTHHLIKDYPVIEISGRHFNRMHIYQINWMKQLPAIAQIKGIHAITVKMMLGIALGYLPDEVLRLRYRDVIGQIHNAALSNYLKDHLDFSKGPNPYLFAKKNGDCYASEFHLDQMVLADRPKIGMKITLQNLRLSFVYSILSRKDLTDEQLQTKLRVNAKSLFYYRQNMQHYNTLVPFKIKQKSSGHDA